jgi:TolA-binding protein
MLHAWAIALLGLTVAIWARKVPTADEMLALFQDGQRLYAVGAYDQAREQFERIRQIDSPLLTPGSVLVSVGELSLPVQEAALYQLGNVWSKQAAAALQLVDGAADKADAATHRARTDEGLNRAAALFRQAATEGGSVELRSLAQSRLVTTWFEAREYDRAIAEAQKLLAVYPGSRFAVNAMYNIAWSRYEQGSYEESVGAFEALIARFPTGYRADRSIFQIAESYFVREDYGKAIEYYRQLPERARVFGLTEQELARMRREKLAGLVDETALEIAAKALLRMGECHNRRGEFGQAREVYRRVIQLFAAERQFVEEAYRRLADIYLQEGDLERSTQVYRDAIDAVRDRVFQARMQSLLAARYLEAGHFDEAIREYQVYASGYDDVAERAGFSVAEAQFSIGQAHYEKGRRALEDGREEEGRGLLRDALLRYRQTLETAGDGPLRVRLLFNVALCRQFMAVPDSVAEALAGFEAIAAEHPDDPFAESSLFQIGRIHFERGEYDPSAAAYQEVMRRFPSSPQLDMARFELGVCRREQGLWQEAVREQLLVGAASPLYHRARIEAAEILVQNGEYPRALDAVGEAVSLGPGPEDELKYLYVKAKALLGAERLAEVAEVATAILSQAADRRMRDGSRYLRGIALLREGRYEEAEQDLRRLTEDANDPALQTSARRMLALSLTQQGRQSEAIANYESLVANSADAEERADYLLLLAELHRATSDYGAVVSTCQSLLGADGTDIKGPEGYTARERALYLLVEAYDRLDRLPDLIEAASDMLRRYPESLFASEVGVTLGQALVRAGQPADAAIQLRRVVSWHRVQTHVEYALYYLGYIEFNQTQFEEAAQVFGRLVREYPESELANDAWLKIGESYSNVGLADQAVDAFGRVLEGWPGTDEARLAMYDMAWALLELRRGEEAMARLRQLCTELPSSDLAPSALFTIGDYYYNEGQHEKALAAYGELVRLYPQDKLAAEVPGIVQDLREAVAYTRYQEIALAFRESIAAGNKEAMRELLPDMQRLAEQYSDTEAGVGVLNNVGIGLEFLNEWKAAVRVYDVVLERCDAGLAGPKAYGFAHQHREWIVATRL